MLRDRNFLQLSGKEEWEVEVKFRLLWWDRNLGWNVVLWMPSIYHFTSLSIVFDVQFWWLQPWRIYEPSTYLVKVELAPLESIHDFWAWAFTFWDQYISPFILLFIEVRSCKRSWQSSPVIFLSLFMKKKKNKNKTCSLYNRKKKHFIKTRFWNTLFFIFKSKIFLNIWILTVFSVLCDICIYVYIYIHIIRILLYSHTILFLFLVMTVYYFCFFFLCLLLFWF